MGIPTERFGVANLDQWGRLVKSWATHLDYVHLQGSPEPPRAYWVNTTWDNTQPPAPATKTDLDTNGNPEPWCLPSGTSVVLPRAGGGTSTLPFAVAMTAADFQKRVQAAGVTITKMPEQYTDVIIVQGTVDTMVMRLPPKDTLQGSEDDLVSGVTYAFQPFYEQIFGTQPNMPPLTDRPAIMELHANRIGEYTLNNCM